jgi:hypothetical protein
LSNSERNLASLSRKSVSSCLRRIAIPASCVKRVTRSSSSVFGPRTVPKYNASVPCTLSLAVTIGVEQQARTPAAIATDVSSAQSGSVATSRTTTCRPSDAATPHEPERSPSGNCANVSAIAGDKPWEATSLSSPAAASSTLIAAPTPGWSCSMSLTTDDSVFSIGAFAATSSSTRRSPYASVSAWRRAPLSMMLARIRRCFDDGK